MLSGVLLHKSGVVPARHKADILAVVLAGVAKMQAFGQRPHLGLGFAAQRKPDVGQLLLCEHIQHIALVFAGIHRLFQQPAPRSTVLLGAGIVPRSHTAQPGLARRLQKLIKLHIAVAVNARVGRSASLIHANEFFDDLLFKIQCKVQHLVGDIQLKSHFGGIVDIPLRAAGVKRIQADIRIPVQPHGRAAALIALLQHQIRRHRAVHAAAHGDQRTFFFDNLHRSLSTLIFSAGGP